MNTVEPEWVRLAREHGGIDEHGNVKLDRALIEDVDLVGRRIIVRIITPFRAPTLTENLEKRSPPFLFDRAPDGHHVFLPIGRFLSALETVRDDPMRSPDERAMVIEARNHGVFSGALAPLSVIQRLVIREGAEEVETELLEPGVRVIIHLGK